MTEIGKGISWRTHTGEAIRVGEVTVTPQSSALSVCWPNGGWVWNRPVAVLVEEGGRTRRVRIVDVTRVAQTGLWGVSAAFGLVMAALSLQELFSRIRSRRGRDA